MNAVLKGIDTLIRDQDNYIIDLEELLRLKEEENDLLNAKLKKEANEKYNLMTHRDSLIARVDELYNPQPTEELDEELYEQTLEDPADEEIAAINILFNEATLSDDTFVKEEARTVVNVIDTVESVIAGNLVSMDKGQTPRLYPDQLLTLVHLRNNWKV